MTATATRDRRHPANVRQRLRAARAVLHDEIHQTESAAAATVAGRGTGADQTDLRPLPLVATGLEGRPATSRAPLAQSHTSPSVIDSLPPAAAEHHFPPPGDPAAAHEGRPRAHGTAPTGAALALTN